VLVTGSAAQALLAEVLRIAGAWMAVLGRPALAAGLPAPCPIGALAIVRRRERSPLVFLALAVGAFVSFPLVGELAASLWR
jgi:hypothetical protein